MAGALVAAMPLTALAVTDTWDGGGADNTITTALNWVDNTAPLSDLANTDLIFAGAVRPTPTFGANFSADSVTFNNTATAFDISGTTPVLTVGTGGIVNNDTDTQTFSLPVAVGTASSSLNAASGGLTFTDSVSVPSGSTLSLDGASTFSFASFSNLGTVTKNGAGSMVYAPTVSSQQGDLVINTGSVFMVADGSTDTFSALASIAVNGTSTLSLNESMTLLGATLTRASGASLSISSGKTLTAASGADIIITGTYTTNTNSNITVADAGSIFSVSSTFTLGSAAVLNVQNGGQFTPGGTVTLNSTATLNIDGSAVNFGGTLNQNGGVVNLIAGSFGFVGNLAVDTTGLLGPNLTLTASRQLTLTGTTTVSAAQTLTLDGGTLNTGTLVNNGAFNFTSGTLGITGGSGLTVGTGGALGATVILNTGQTLNVTNTTTVASTGTLVVGDGLLNAAGGIVNNGEIRLSGTAPRITGGAITNNKTIRGDGRIDNNLTNASAGELRAESGKTLLITGVNGSNTGKINLQGGTVQFSQALVNAAAGTITGRGFLYIDGGLTNNGQVQLSAGLTDVYGTVTSNSGSKIIVTGGGTSTFYNPVTMNAGSEFRVSADSTAVFFGNVTGTDNFTGSGTKIFESGSSSFASLSSGVGDTVVEAAATLTANQINEDALTVNGVATIAGPGASSANAVTVSGTLNLGANNLSAGTVTLVDGAINGAGGVITAGSYAVHNGSASATLAGAGALTKSTGGTVTLTADNTYTGGTHVQAGTLLVNRMHANNAVTISGGTLQVVESSPGLGSGHPAGSNAFVSRPSSLTITAGGTLDVTNNDVILDYSGASPIATYEALVASAYNVGVGDWSGAGITSSVAALDGNYVVAIADNAALAAPFGTAQGGPLFAGADVDLDTILIKFTHRADVDLDGVVTPNDSAIFGGNYDETVTSGATWSMGDMDYDGAFTPNDAAIFGGFYDEALVSLPEPAGVGMLALASLLLVRRARGANLRGA